VIEAEGRAIDPGRIAAIIQRFIVRRRLNRNSISHIAPYSRLPKLRRLMLSNFLQSTIQEQDRGCVMDRLLALGSASSTDRLTSAKALRSYADLTDSMAPPCLVYRRTSNRNVTRLYSPKRSKLRYRPCATQNLRILNNSNSCSQD